MKKIFSYLSGTLTDLTVLLKGERLCGCFCRREGDTYFPGCG